MRQVKIVVGGTPVREQPTWAYPAGKTLGIFLTPVYHCWVEGTDAAGRAVREQFDVLRFGVQCKDGRTAEVVGLADFQTHVIRAWLPNYPVHIATSNEHGAWQVFGNFLIHDGPDNVLELFATIGCIEIMGPQGFAKFNDLVISLSGPKAISKLPQLHEIGSAGHMSITYRPATRPPLKKAP